MHLLKRVIQKILQEELGRNYHTIDPQPNTFRDFQDFDVEIVPDNSGVEYLLYVSYKKKFLIKGQRLKNYEEANNIARQAIDSYRVTIMNHS